MIPKKIFQKILKTVIQHLSCGAFYSKKRSYFEIRLKCVISFIFPSHIKRKNVSQFLYEVEAASGALSNAEGGGWLT
jgi:hypothetical protein